MVRRLNEQVMQRSVEDLKGLKIRMMGNPVFVDSMNALGGNGVAMGFDQLINAMQTGVVDGQENTWSNIYTQKMHEVQKYITVTNHGYIGYAVIEVVAAIVTRSLSLLSDAGHVLRHHRRLNRLVGDAYCDLGQRDEAVQHLQRAFDADPMFTNSVCGSASTTVLLM